MIFLPLVQEMPVVGRPAPDVAFRRTDGSMLRLSSLRGKMVVLEFTAYACAPCLTFAPKLEAFAKAHPNVVFLTISTGPESELPRLAALRGKDARTLLVKDPYDEARAKMQVWKFGNVGTPTMFLITPKGNVGSRALQDGERDLPYLRSRMEWVGKRGL